MAYYKESGFDVSPVVEYYGTVKVHGTNGSIVRYPNGEVKFQSKERTLDIHHDNFGFLATLATRMDLVSELFLPYVSQYPDRIIQISGEWFGEGIQKGVAVSNCDRSFMIFGVALLDPELPIEQAMVNRMWLPLEKLHTIAITPICEKENVDYGWVFYSHSVFLKKITIDFSQPELVQNELIELTNQVEHECPVGKMFGYSGIGEGIVWKPLDPFLAQTPAYWFKVKGDKHASSKVTKLASVDTEKLNSIKDFVDYAVTENRVKQAMQETGAVDKKDTGKIAKWIMNDIAKEELDTLVHNNLTLKEVGGACSKRAVEIYFKIGV